MSSFQSATIKKYTDEGYYVLNLISTNKNGIPDLLCLKKGEEPLFVECKEKKDTLKELQKFRIRELKKLGFKAICIKKGEGIIY